MHATTYSCVGYHKEWNKITGLLEACRAALICISQANTGTAITCPISDHIEQCQYANWSEEGGACRNELEGWRFIERKGQHHEECW